MRIPKLAAVRGSVWIRGMTATIIALGVLSAASCRDDGVSAPGARSGPRAPSFNADLLFEQAGAEFGVPAELLKAISYVETRWQMVRGTEEFPGKSPAFGLMALSGERLRLGAELARVTVADAQSDPLANVRAAAALLRSYADELRLDRSQVGEWAPAVARFSGIASSEGQAAYVHDDVYATLRSGTQVRRASGISATIFSTDVQPRFPIPGPRFSASDYSSAIWRPSPNFNSRPTGPEGDVHMAIIHTCEGSYTSCWSWLVNPDAGVSAHYVVKEDGSEISQLVHEADRAWHIGAKYDCTLNSDHDCSLNGFSSNHFTVGIEHGGFASQTSFPVEQIDASAKLACAVSQRHGIPRDRMHFVAHGQLQPANRTDPGPNWPWDDYINRIRAHCTATIIVDSNNNNNDTTKAKMQVSSNWTSSNATAGYYGTGYWYATTAAVSDPATFWFYLPEAVTRTVDAWWTAGTNRSTTAPYIMWNAAGTKLATVNVNQQTNGGKWNTLGTFSFTAGWNKVQLSRWTTAGYVVIADAVRIR